MENSDYEYTAKSFKPKSSQEWVDFWINRFSNLLSKLRFSTKESQSYVAIVRKYLNEYPGNPKSIEIEKLKRFVLKRKNDIRKPLLLFYSEIAHSDLHIAALQDKGK